MWIRRSEWERMQQRIGDLERTRLTTNITLRTGVHRVIGGHCTEFDEFPLTNVIISILDHLGLRMVRTPSRVSLEPKQDGGVPQ